MPGTGAIRWGDISFRVRQRPPTEPPILTRRTRDQQTGGTGVMGTEGHGRGAGGRRRGLDSTASAAGVEGAGGSGGPGRGAGGWRQGQGGPRDRPLRAVRLACGDLVGGPPPTGTHSGQAYRGRPCGADGGRAGRRPPAHRATRPNQVDHAQWTVGRPPPTGTQSDQTELGRSCAVDGGRTEQPGLTQHAAHRTPAVPHSKQNSSNTTKNAHSNTSIHSFTATLPKVI